MAVDGDAHPEALAALSEGAVRLSGSKGGGSPMVTVGLVAVPPPPSKRLGRLGLVGRRMAGLVGDVGEDVVDTQLLSLFEGKVAALPS